MDAGHAEVARPTSSVRDTGLLREELASWLVEVLPEGSDPVVDHVVLPSANGMSSETILFDATWTEGADRADHQLVARVAPGATTMPVFPSYDLHSQYLIMRAVRGHVPVPTVLWSEQSSDALGAPFFVMERVDGDVPPDVMPYNFGSWVTEATHAQRERMQAASVGVLAALHAIPLADFAFLGTASDAGTALRAHIASQREYYEWVVGDGPRSPLLDRCLDELEATCPVDSSPAVFCWGDARIGNIMYRDFEPVAVLDWEMATIGPRELDIAWMIFLHRFFEDLTRVAGLPGLPDFLRRDDVAATYRDKSGHDPTNLNYFIFYAAVRHAIVMFRVQSRAIHFGQAAAPANPDDMILHHTTLAEMLDGTYWDRIA